MVLLLFRCQSKIVNAFVADEARNARDHERADRKRGAVPVS